MPSLLAPRLALPLGEPRCVTRPATVRLGPCVGMLTPVSMAKGSLPPTLLSPGAPPWVSYGLRWSQTRFSLAC